MADQTILAIRRRKKSRRGQVVIGKITKFLSGRLVFMVLLTIAVMLSGFLIWERVIQPLNVASGLPAGVSDTPPTIDSESAKAVAEHRAQRVQSPPRTFSQFSSAFTRF